MRRGAVRRAFGRPGADRGRQTARPKGSEHPAEPIRTGARQRAARRRPPRSDMQSRRCPPNGITTPGFAKTHHLGPEAETRARRPQVDTAPPNRRSALRLDDESSHTRDRRPRVARTAVPHCVRRTSSSVNQQVSWREMEAASRRGRRRGGTAGFKSNNGGPLRRADRHLRPEVRPTRPRPVGLGSRRK